MKTKPSDFLNFPSRSVFQKCEYETVARNIMKILAQTGDKFRSLSWKEYKETREKDGSFSLWEKNFFQQARKYTINKTKAKSFSPSWADNILDS